MTVVILVLTIIRGTRLGNQMENRMDKEMETTISVLLCSVDACPCRCACELSMPRASRETTI